MAVYYTREQIEEEIQIPYKVESELKQNIAELLDRCGIFHTVISRRKTSASLEHKYSSGKYGEEKKIQDLVGVRVILYYQDDISICRKLFDTIYGAGEWATSESGDSNFTATKTNGVFRLPDYLIQLVNPAVWEMSIDQTFEIQLRTVYFEGWHEVEHDLRYKYLDIWEDESYRKYSRQLNSVIATLELCDASMITTLDNFAHKLYEEERWEEMLRMHFRIRMTDQELYPELFEIFSADKKAYGKMLFKCDRSKLILRLATFQRSIPISVNMVVSLLNEFVFKGETESYKRVQRIMRKHDVYHDGLFVAQHEAIDTQLQPFGQYPIFSNKVLVRGEGDVFDEVAEAVYTWAREKYINIFPAIPSEVKAGAYGQSGYYLEIKYDREQRSMWMFSSHFANNVPCRSWETVVTLQGEPGGDGVWFETSNSIMDKETVNDQERLNNFSVPMFYRRICSNPDYEIIDAARYQPKLRYGKLVENDSQAVELMQLICSRKRNTAVVLVVSPGKVEDIANNPNYLLSGKTLYQIAHTISIYTHVYAGFAESLKPMLCNCMERLRESMEAEAYGELQESTEKCAFAGVYVFGPDGTIQYFSPQDIESCSYNRHFGPYKKYSSMTVVSGEEAFQYMLIDEINRNLAIHK